MYLKEKLLERENNRVICTAVRLCKNEHRGYVRVGLDIKRKTVGMFVLLTIWAIFVIFAMFFDHTNQLVHI